MRFIGNVETDGQVRVVASGALPNGKPVVVNSDGTASTVSIGSPSASTPVSNSVAYDNDSLKYSVLYDTSLDKVVVVYQNQSDNYPMCVVGSISGTSITFGTPVVIASKGTNQPQGAVDNAGTVFAAYQGGPSDLIMGSAGTISGNSVTFGTQVQLNSTRPTYTAVIYDSGSNAFIAGWRDNADTQRIKVVPVQTSGTSVTVGNQQAITTSGKSCDWTTLVYDPNADKTFLANRNITDTQGECWVLTLSWPNISAGSKTIFISGQNPAYLSADYDSTAQKIVFGYNYGGAGYARTVTISGTTVSLGTQVQWSTASVYHTRVIYDPSANKTTISYRDGNNSNYGTFKVGTVSGTNISFDSGTVFNAAQSDYFKGAYIPDISSILLFYTQAPGSVRYYTFLAAAPSSLNANNFIGFSDSAYASGQSASIDSTGSINNRQTGLTAGSKYYVQKDGTLSTTAGSPSVEAGIALSATELLVKG